MSNQNEKLDYLITSINNTFLDYFYIFGLNTETILSKELYNHTQFEGEHDNIKPTLISKFPPFNKTKSNIDENIILQHCFPNGFKVIEHVCPPSNELFHFSLDNLMYKNKRIYFTCLLFYERLSSYNECRKYYNLLNTDFYLDIEEKKTNEMSEVLEMEKNENGFFNEDDLNITYMSSSPQINRSHELRLNEFVTTRLTFSKKRQTIRLNKESFFPSIYIPKVICLSSKSPFPEEKAQILNLLFNYVNNGEDKIFPIEKIIENIMLEIPFPPKGIYQYFYIFNNLKIKISRSPLNKYQIYSYKFHYIFSFSTNDIITIYKYILLEFPILFFSENKEKLTNIIESFIILLFPFKYQYPYISILPDINSSMIENEECFIFGINQKLKNKKYYLNELYNLKLQNKYILFCDIDEGNIKTICQKDILRKIELNDFKKLEKKNIDGEMKIVLSNEINTHNHDIINTIQLPEHYSLKLKAKLDELVKKASQIFIKNQNMNLMLSFEIISLFSYYLISLLLNYNNFLFNEKKEVLEICRKIKTNKIELKDMWKEKEFNEYVKNEERDFYNVFIRTKLFQDFLQRKYYHEFGGEDLEFLFLDEQIAKKKNKNLFSKKINTFFISLNDFSVNKTIKIPSFNKFNKEEIEYISNNYILFSKYFQKLNDSKYHYFVFPKLIYDNKFFGKKYFNENLEYPSLNINNEYMNVIKKVLSLKEYKDFYNKDLICQYHYVDYSITFIQEIENSIFLIWLQLFSMTFYYIKNTEKKIRFYEMMENIKQLIYFDKITFSLIFNALYKYGTDNMLISFYNFINHNYIHNSLLTSKLEIKSFRKSFSKKLTFTTSDNIGKNVIYYKGDEIDEMFKLTDENIKKIKKRSFGNEKEEIIFELKIQCPNCKQYLEITLITMNFNIMNKMYIKCPCPKCKKEINPDLKVKCGNKIEIINLYNPWYIYRICCDQLLQENGLKLNLKRFREKNPYLYWNCIWFFTMKGLSYDILLEYKDNCKIHESDINYNIGDYFFNVNENNNLCSSFENIQIENVINITIDNIKV